MSSGFLERLREEPLLCDGAYYLEMERRCIGSYASDIPRGVLDHPEGVLELHREFARAGAEVLQAMAWGVGPMDREEELHRVAVELAREAAGPNRFVAGTLSPVAFIGLSGWGTMSRRQRSEAQAFYERRVEQQQAGPGSSRSLDQRIWSVMGPIRIPKASQPLPSVTQCDRACR